MRHILVATLFAVSCAGYEDPELEEDSQAAIMNNAIMNNAIMNNALTANRTASEKLGKAALRDATFLDPYLAEQIEDPDARKVLAYLYGCAGGPNDRLKISGRFGTEVYQGVLGLAPIWMNAAPPKRELEQVSACLVSRVNAYGVRVDYSMRGQPAFRFPNWAEVGPTPTYLHTNTQVASLGACTAPTPNCGWGLDRVGNCSPGTSAIVSTYALGGSSQGSNALRVCPGIRACDDTGAVSMTHAYSAGRDQVGFVCPSSGQFSVMKFPSNPAVPIRTGGQVTGGKFPAPEGWTTADYAVFPWAEGSFFGNIFGAANFDKNFQDSYCDPKKHVCFHPTQNPNQTAFKCYACGSDVWNDAVAYMNERVCAAGQRGPCLCERVGKCSSICALSDGLERIGDGDFQECKAPSGTIYTTGVTTYLNERCAINIYTCDL